MCVCVNVCVSVWQAGCVWTRDGWSNGVRKVIFFPVLTRVKLFTSFYSSHRTTMRGLVSLIIIKVQFASFFSTNGTLIRSCATKYLSRFLDKSTTTMLRKDGFSVADSVTFRFEEHLDGSLDKDEQIKT